MLPLLVASLFAAAIGQSIDQSTDQSIDQSTHQSLFDILPESLFHGTPGPAVYLKSINQPSNESTNQSITESINQSIDQSINADVEVFSMSRVCSSAPWSARIQPAILPMFKDVTYKNWYTGTTTSQSDWLILYEGSLGSRWGWNLVAENDVWASGDGGVTWDLIAGISSYGGPNETSAYGYQKQSSFRPRLGATNCEDPSSDIVYSIGGYVSSLLTPMTGTNEVWASDEGISWWRWWSSGLPNRYYASCDIDVSGHVYTMGGISIEPSTLAQTLLNDVWSDFNSSWSAATLKAPWSPRAEHLVLITENHRLGRNIIYVLGGMIRVDATASTNDVWASSDQGQTWIKMPTPGWKPRWGHAGITTDAGVIVVLGGADSRDGKVDGMFSYQDVWASFDGASTWSNCRLPVNADFVRTEQGASLLPDGRLVMASGQTFCPMGECQSTRYEYRDVWVSDFSLEDTKQLAAICNAKVPDYIGLKTWPGQSGNPNSLFIMNPLTHNAPWSARVEPALLRMSKPVKYTQANSGLTISTPPNWMLMYEGSTYYIGWINGDALENDVWASGDNGRTWDVIAGTSWISGYGVKNSSHPDTSYQGRQYAANCEDPTNDDVFSLGGARWERDGFEGSDLVQFSTDSQNWHIRKGDVFSPKRWLASCDVTNTGVLIMIGGVSIKKNTQREFLLNDVWRATDQGRRWELANAEPPFSARSEHQVVIYGSELFEADIIYVVGGYDKYQPWNDVYHVTNDIWASRDLGSTWVAINEAPGFSGRFGHGVVVTEDTGVLMVVGGANSKTHKQVDMMSTRDVWVSLDGGYLWSSCKLPKGVDYIRVNQGVQLLEDNRLLLISGYSLYPNWNQRSYKDVYQSVIAIDDLDKLSQVCVDIQIPPNEKLGLRLWPGEAPPPDPEDEGKQPPITTKGLVVVILVSLAVVACLGFAVWSKRASLFPSMFRSETQMVDYSQTLFDNPRLPTEAEEGATYKINPSTNDEPETYTNAEESYTNAEESS